MGLLDKIFKRNGNKEEAKNYDIKEIKNELEKDEEKAIGEEKTINEEKSSTELEYETYKNKTVRIFKEDNTEIQVKQFCRMCKNDIGLLTDTDGDKKIFHIYLDCYEDWPPQFSNGFIGWKEKNISLLNDYRMCARCQERLYRHDNPKAIITGYDFNYYYEKFNDENDYNYIDYFENDSDVVCKLENDNKILEIYNKHMVLKSKSSSSIKNISYDINNIDEYFNLKTIEFKSTEKDNLKLLSVYYLPLMCHPRTQDFFFYFVEQKDFDECQKVVDYINDLVIRKNEILADIKKREKEAKKEKERNNTNIEKKSKPKRDKELDKKIYEYLSVTVDWEIDERATDEWEDENDIEEKADKILDKFILNISRKFSDAITLRKIEEKRIFEILDDILIELDEHNNPKWWIKIDMYEYEKMLLSLLKDYEDDKKEIKIIFKD